jgi:hypothetical protein
MSPAIISRFSHGRRIPFTFPTLQSHHPRQLLISGMIALWAGRLGYYLFGVSLSRSFFLSLSRTLVGVAV